MEAVRAALRDHEQVAIGNASDPVILRRCDQTHCRRMRLTAIGVAAVGIGLTAWTGHQAILAVVLLAIAFLGQLLVCG